MFEFVEHKKTGESAIMINEGEYDSIVFKFLDGKLKLTDSYGEPLNLDTVDEIPIDFDYEVLYNPKDMNIFDNEFKDFLGDIFMTLMYESVKHGSYRLNDENRNDDTEQSTTE